MPLEGPQHATSTKTDGRLRSVLNSRSVVGVVVQAIEESEHQHAPVIGATNGKQAADELTCQVCQGSSFSCGCGGPKETALANALATPINIFTGLEDASLCFGRASTVNVRRDIFRRARVQYQSVVAAEWQAKEQRQTATDH
eukprot:CAMPEP_0115874958 /NCGR_PEP_ID=MMETSP0287-20121206/24831_1 /TAXON_ID=412157 /ORGANISM="Chrysochromulina rotalis, Strain UIO044" /LENGTH=141 /DNA_ID=CAMNT_0003330169 /DNA_START=138 /DNA_END=563 /DNA_ORIENTATION=+